MAYIKSAQDEFSPDHWADAVQKLIDSEMFKAMSLKAASCDIMYSRCKSVWNVHLFSKESLDFIKEHTGKRYSLIHLKEDDPLLTLILLKFKGEEIQ